jgi:hypothetical protein
VVVFEEGDDVVIVVLIDSDLMRVEDKEFMVAGWMLLIARCCQCML